MCYYSRTMRSEEYRDVKVGEDLTTYRDGSGHAMLRGEDGKAVCVRDNMLLHIEEVRTIDRQYMPLAIQPIMDKYIGKPVSGVFMEYHTGLGYARDSILIDGRMVHLGWLAPGLKCYVGPKRPTKLEATLGVDEQTIKGAALDHRAPDTDVDRVLAPREYVNSITR